MNNFLKESVNFSQRVNQTSPDDLVLEDTVEETETVLGHGQANIFKAPDEKTAVAGRSETRKANKKIYKQRLLFDRDLLSEVGNANADFKEKELADCSQFKDVPQNSEVVLLARQIKDKAPYVSWKDRQIETSVKGNDQYLSLPPIFLSKICPKQKPKNVQLDTAYSRNIEKPKEKEKKEEKIKCEQMISKQTLDLIDNKPKVNLRMKLEQIKKGVKLDQKNSDTMSITIKGSLRTENADETITESVCETSGSEIDAVGVSHSADKDFFLHMNDPQNVQRFQPVPLELQVAKDLKKLVLGSASLTFRDEWKFQGFSLTDASKLQYGIIQKKSGPCGIFSVVQAFVLRHLLFTGNPKSSSRRSLEPNIREKTTALASALADIVWQAGQQKKSVVAILGKKAHLNPSSIRTDGVTEKVLVVTLDRYEDLLYFLTQNIDQYRCTSGQGLILSVYSAILSRTVQGVHDNMDDPDGKLIDSSGCSSQELVNLFLTGNAATNNFNNDMETRDSSGNKVIRKGIRSRSEIGLLSLSECQGLSCEVGTYLKTPKYPIWLVQTGNSFSILFSPKKDILSDWKAEKKFDLYYYNCLCKQCDEIKLTIDSMNISYCPPPEEDVVSPVELCIRTKWNQAEIYWNGIEPLI